MAFLDPVGLAVLFGAIAAAYGVGRLIRWARARRARSLASRTHAPPSRAERRRRDRGRR